MIVTLVAVEILTPAYSLAFQLLDPYMDERNLIDGIYCRVFYAKDERDALAFIELARELEGFATMDFE